jgi:hypothetical protein
MKVTEFAKLVAQREGKKQQKSIAQIMEQLKIENELLNGELYSMIRKIKV